MKTKTRTGIYAGSRGSKGSKGGFTFTFGLGIPLAMVIVTGLYFARGINLSLKRVEALSSKLDQSNLTLEKVRKQHKEAFALHSSLSGDYSDPALANEILRQDLGWVTDNEIIILMPKSEQ